MNNPESCPGPVSRREILHIGGLSLLGVSLPQVLAAREDPVIGSPSSMFGRAKNVIFLYLAGGPPQHETFDPKPDAPVEVRGEFHPISTNVPGIHFCELLPRTARIADRLAIVRSMATDDHVHSSSGAWVLTGHPYSGSNARTIQAGDWPYLGSIVKMLKPSEALSPLTTVWIPDWMRLNENVTPSGQTAGLIGRRWDPERFVGDPNRDDYQVDGLQLSGSELARFATRRQLLERLDRGLRHSAGEESLSGFDRYHQQAFDLLTTGSAVDAFRIDREPPALRERYGRNSWGQCVLLARRLVEAGVRLVHVQWPRMPGDNAVDNPLWDTHAQNFDRLEDVLCPIFDVGFSALIEDLDDRGLLDETLVVAIGEFGRTPRINNKAGRDHWGNVFSFAAAGAGIAGAQVIGASDPQGGYPVEDRVEPGDLAATIYHLLGIDHRRMVNATDGRAIPLTHGSPIEKLLGTRPVIEQRVQAGGDLHRVPPYVDRLLTHTDFHSVDVRTFEGAPRPKSWRADPLMAGSVVGWGVETLPAGELSGPLSERHVAIGITTPPDVVTEIPWSTQAALTQEVRSPFAGTFVLTVEAALLGSSEEFARSLFGAHVRLRMALFEFIDAGKHPAHRKELASSELNPVFQELGPEPTLETFRLEKTFAPDQPGQNISFGLGLGVAVIAEKTSSGTLVLEARSARECARLHLARIDLGFAGKERDENVQV